MEEISFKFWKFWLYLSLTAVTVSVLDDFGQNESPWVIWEPLLFQCFNVAVIWRRRRVEVLTYKSDSDVELIFSFS